MLQKTQNSLLKKKIYANYWLPNVWGSNSIIKEGDDVMIPFNGQVIKVQVIYITLLVFSSVLWVEI